MGPWKQRALSLLTESLDPSPTELNALDWKQELSPNKKKLSEHLSAFGNEPGGGFFAFGVDSSANIVGVEESQVNRAIEQIGNLARDSVTPQLRVEHFVEMFRGKPVLFIHIVESPEKPVHLRGKSIEESFIRSAGQTRKMSKQELGSALMRSKTIKFEELPAYPLASFSSRQDLVDQFDWAVLYSLLKRPIPTGDSLVHELMSMRLFMEDGNTLLPTNLGVLVAAKDVSLFRGHERRGIRIIFYKGSSRVDTEHEFSDRRGYAVGFQSIIQFLVQRLPSSEVIRDALRTNAPRYPEVALREIIANALIHQDLGIDNRSPMVEVFLDRIEVSNPGRLVPSITVPRIIDASAESRNEILARFLCQLGICEERGSGIDRALGAIELWNLPPIEFKEEENNFRVIIHAPRTYKQMGKEERIRTTYQHACLQRLSGSAMTNASLRKRLGIQDSNYPLVSRIINDSVAARQVKPLDPDNKAKKHIKYIPYWA